LSDGIGNRVFISMIKLMGSPELLTVIPPMGGTAMQSDMIYRSGGSSPLPTPYGRNKLQGHLSRLSH